MHSRSPRGSTRRQPKTALLLSGGNGFTMGSKEPTRCVSNRALWRLSRCWLALVARYRRSICMSPESATTPGPADFLRPTRMAWKAPSRVWLGPGTNLRRLKAVGKLGEGAVVNLRGGTYRLTESLAFGPQDAGTRQAPIAWRAYGDEKAILTGSLPVRGFKPWKGQIVVADLKGTPLEKAAFRQLFFRGERQVMARYPNVDPKDPHFGQWAYVLATDPAPASNQSVSDNIPQAKDHFTATHDVIKPTWEKIAQAEIAIHPTYGWAWNIVPVKSVDRETDTIWLGHPVSYGLMIGDRYFVQNLLAELDAPGKWYPDRDDAKLYFWPPAALTSGEVNVPVADSLIVADGAGCVTVRGFTIENCSGNGATLKNCEGCLVAGCTIHNTGMWGVFDRGWAWHGSGGQRYLCNRRRRHQHQRWRPQDSHPGRLLRRQQLHPSRCRLSADLPHRGQSLGHRKPGNPQPDPRLLPPGDSRRRQRPCGGIQRRPPYESGLGGHRRALHVLPGFHPARHCDSLQRVSPPRWIREEQLLDPGSQWTGGVSLSRLHVGNLPRRPRSGCNRVIRAENRRDLRFCVVIGG